MRREPGLEIRGAVRPAEVRFEVKPEVTVLADSDSPASPESVSEREKLPDELDCGTTYRDFSIRWRAAA